MRMTHLRELSQSDAARFILGGLQMFGAVVSAVLLLTVGVARVSLIAVTVTSLLTTVSVVIFGGHRTRRRS